MCQLTQCFLCEQVSRVGQSTRARCQAMTAAQRSPTESEHCAVTDTRPQVAGGKLLAFFFYLAAIILCAYLVVSFWSAGKFYVWRHKNTSKMDKSEEKWEIAKWRHTWYFPALLSFSVPSRGFNNQFGIITDT